ncbi:MAG: hypothetical protein HUJ31_10560, partial [Pseudomonadales bacterium]|nr:hypothetical protein [Pseudomonadales bacterium]
NKAVQELEAGGFEIITAEEHRGYDLFDDVGAIVWYLQMVPWQIPDFTVERYRDRLMALDRRIREDGPLDAGSHHFCLVARKTGPGLPELPDRSSWY